MVGHTKAITAAQIEIEECLENFWKPKDSSTWNFVFDKVNEILERNNNRVEKAILTKMIKEIENREVKE
jgi:hypothetical protein